jgi:hypothetical protein
MAEHMRKKFVKDFSLSIPVTESPYFEYFLNLYEHDYKAKTTFDHFVETVTSYEQQHNGKSLLGDANTLSKKVRSVVGSTSEWSQFQDNVRNTGKQYELRKTMQVKNTGKVYCRENLNKYFISVDISSGNFTCLKYHNPAILLNCENFRELVKYIAQLEFKCEDEKELERTDFDDSVVDYVSSSKQLRQVIFGYLNPKIQQTIQRFLIGLVIEVIVQHANVPIEKFIACTSDEVIFECEEDKFQELYELTKSLIEQHLPQLQKNLKVEAFTLASIGENDRVAGFSKEFKFDSNSKGLLFELKGVAGYLFAQAYKKYKGLPIEQNDLLFTYEGMIAFFKDGFFN